VLGQVAAVLADVEKLIKTLITLVHLARRRDHQQHQRGPVVAARRLQAEPAAPASSPDP